jgi:hypothetical protein
LCKHNKNSNIPQPHCEDLDQKNKNKNISSSVVEKKRGRQYVILPLGVIDEPPINMQKEMM